MLIVFMSLQNLVTSAIILPNMLRQSCLVFISTYCHYFGDIPDKDVFFQTQILDHWCLLPFQLFCFNFGKTHGIHHFVAKQPFYLRTALANQVIPTMIENGVRRNDMFCTFRCNRYFSENLKKQQ